MVFVAMLITFIVSKIVFSNMSRNNETVAKFDVKLLEVIGKEPLKTL